MKGLQGLANFLIIVGALNWGLVGLFDYNLIEWLLGGIGLVQIVYVLVGISGLLKMFGWGKK